MPTKRTAWACAFGCARSVLINKAKMVAHEKVCFSNPATRSCKTCRHNFGEWDDNGVPTGEPYAQSWFIRGCDIEKLPKDKIATTACRWWEHINSKEIDHEDGEK